MTVHRAGSDKSPSSWKVRCIAGHTREGHSSPSTKHANGKIKADHREAPHIMPLLKPSHMQGRTGLAGLLPGMRALSGRGHLLQAWMGAGCPTRLDE